MCTALAGNLETWHSSPEFLTPRGADFHGDGMDGGWYRLGLLGLVAFDGTFGIGHVKNSECKE